MKIKRGKYLNKLISKKNNGMIKVITGLRRSGKSYLLFELYHEYLSSIGINDENIIELALDEDINIKYRDPLELGNYIRSKTENKEQQYYIFLDEIQQVYEIQNPYVNLPEAKVGFVDVLLGLMKIKNLDIYITGSNSRMLSTDILTTFRGRGDEIKVNPLTFAEFYNAYEEDKHNALRDYMTYGGMPYVMTLKNHEDKSSYLKDLFARTYLSDVIERNKVNNEKGILEDLLNIISSSIGSLTNPSKLSKTFKSVKQTTIASQTIEKYLDYFIDAFLIKKAYRYDVKGKKYINTPLKYYFSDIGLRNARLNFRQQEENHIMENIIFNELIARDFDVDVGVVEYNSKDDTGKKVRVQLEVDFIANKGSNRFYIQSALHIDTDEKREQEINSLLRVDDSFKKIVVVKDNINPWYDENGIFYIGVEEFLLKEQVMDSYI
ncbi:MAG: ATP-binding protein [Lachnospiraceae bacterium]|nr:ATP-binding protein [Lachnospiraceae bacterium]